MRGPVPFTKNELAPPLKEPPRWKGDGEPVGIGELGVRARVVCELIGAQRLAERLLDLRLRHLQRGAPDSALNLDHLRLGGRGRRRRRRGRLRLGGRRGGGDRRVLVVAAAREREAEPYQSARSAVPPSRNRTYGKRCNGVNRANPTHDDGR
ncbi:MAG: hypothetical protein ACR2NH_10185, partial [Solirubrobacteraceae bacterium]